MSSVLGVDVGGTFTDFVYSDGRDGLSEVKVPTNPDDLVGSFVEGLEQLAALVGEQLEDFVSQIPLIVHGTTITTNAVITRSGSRTGLLTTKGLRDSLQMRKSKKEEPYNLRYQAPSPVIPRQLRLPVSERLDWKGDVLIPLDVEDLQSKIAILRRDEVESVAICYLHSYVNDEHEQQTLKQVMAEMPGTYVISSAEALPIVGFYDRVSTIAMAAYVGPILSRYLTDLQDRLNHLGFQGSILIMKSDGGVTSPEIALRNPAVTLMSGPAGGPRAALQYLTPHGTDRCITIDMGGTSFEASLIDGGEPLVVPKGDIDRLRTALPMLDVRTIGAGGGSVAWFDHADLLRLGPRSAGAVPGPACYGNGGEEPTCTDASVVLGYINPNYFLAGRLKLDSDLAVRAIERHVASRLGVDVEAAAAAIFEIMTVNMASAIRGVSVGKGHDPRHFPLVVAGGAGAIHAATIAEELGIKKVIVPVFSATFCATGMLFSDLQHDYVRSVWRPGKDTELARATERFDEMIAEASRDLEREGVNDDQIEWRHSAEMRYAGQFHEVRVPVDPAELAEGIALTAAQRFEELHDQLYGHTVPDGRVEVVHLRTTAIGKIPHPTLSASASETGAPDPTDHRRAYLPNRGSFSQVPVYRNLNLGAGTSLPGPLLIDLPLTTLFVPETWRVSNDDLGSYVLVRGDE